MEIIEILGYVSALFVGITLGLIGGGGSILTLPILVYLLGVQPLIATAYSLFVVGASALVGTITNLKRNQIDSKIAILFALPSLLGVYLTRKYVILAIPQKLLTIGEFVVTKETGIMLLFAFIMLVAAGSMIRKKKTKKSSKTEKEKFNYPVIILEGLGVGFLTGLVGAGGGFLIIPALVLLAKLPMKKAVSTSLFIIAVKSLIGFVGDIENLEIDWAFLLSFTACSILGIFIGISLSQYIKGQKLKRAFGWFILIMGINILLKEFFL